MLVNRYKKPYELIFDIRKFDSFKTSLLKQRRLCRLYLRTHTNISRSVIRRMSLHEFLYKRLCVVYLIFNKI